MHLLFSLLVNLGANKSLFFHIYVKMTVNYKSAFMNFSILGKNLISNNPQIIQMILFYFYIFNNLIIFHRNIHPQQLLRLQRLCVLAPHVSSCGSIQIKVLRVTCGSEIRSAIADFCSGGGKKLFVCTDLWYYCHPRTHMLVITWCCSVRELDQASSCTDGL